jgi:hypothetical protein
MSEPIPKVSASIFVLEDPEYRIGNDMPIEIFATREEALNAWKAAGGRGIDFKGYFVRFNNKSSMINWIKVKLL